MIIAGDVKKIVEENAAALATVNEDGSPHCIAVADVKVIGGKLLIGDNYMVNTGKNIRRDQRVAVTVWNRNWEEDCAGYELAGTAEYFSAGKYLDMVKLIHEGYPAKGAILVTVGKIKKLA
jgi:predicted pyridoxine 5'-phosphate oxidase superfamily flavin-nucleotide-binding protein